MYQVPSFFKNCFMICEVKLHQHSGDDFDIFFYNCLFKNPDVEVWLLLLLASEIRNQIKQFMRSLWRFLWEISRCDVIDNPSK